MVDKKMGYSDVEVKEFTNVIKDTVKMQKEIDDYKETPRILERKQKKRQELEKIK